MSAETLRQDAMRGGERLHTLAPVAPQLRPSCAMDCARDSAPVATGGAPGSMACARADLDGDAIQVGGEGAR